MAEATAPTTAAVETRASSREFMVRKDWIGSTATRLVFCCEFRSQKKAGNSGEENA